MKQIISSSSNPFERERNRNSIAFTQEFHRIVVKSSIKDHDIRIATLDETRKALLLAHEMLPVAAIEVVQAIYAHNPECFRIVERLPFCNSYMMAYLPLTASGAAALVGGTFDALSPDLQHICKPDEELTAIYLWLVYVPRNMIAGLRLIQELEAIGGGRAIFTRPAHRESHRILKMAGFIDAQDIFPSAPQALLVALTLGESGAFKPRKLAISIRVARDFHDIAKIVSIRTATYINEQACTFVEEFDGNDLCATHLVGEIDGEPAGCVRIRYFGEFAKLERLAVRPEFRRSRLMWKIVKAAFDHCARKGFTKLYAHAREDLVPAWERFGARPMEGRQPFFFSDVKFQEMELDLPQHAHTIRFGADPMLLIRPEGEWDALGPIDRAQLIRNPERRIRAEDNRRSGRSNHNVSSSFL